jgi:RNA polymerase sigma-70 factor (ECF subfamily)
MAGDSTAETELVNRYSRAVAALIARNTPGRGDAEDLFQETFCIVLQRIRNGSVRDPERLSGFVCAVARNVSIGHVRSIDSTSQSDVAADATPAPGSSQIDQILERENAELIRRVLRELPSARDRDVLRRFYLAEESKTTVSQAIGLSSLQFDQVLFRARQRYRALYFKAIGRER